MDWLFKSFVAMIWVVPAYLMIGFVNKQFGMRPEITMIWYFFGILIGSPLLLYYLNIPLSEFKLTIAIPLVIFVGIVIGAFANMLLFSSIAVAPNPGLPIAIVNISSVLVFIFSVSLAVLLPKYFDAVRFDIYHLAGILLTILGISIISLHK